MFTHRHSVVLYALLGILIAGILWASLHRRDSLPSGRSEETPPPIIDKLPVNFTSRSFDPAMPPADMPPLTAGENAECDSNFLSNASVSGEAQKTDATHGTVTITQVKVTLQLNITIWVPTDATQHVIEHEEGHRQISEYYYRSADKIARQVAETHLGKRADITGANLDAESSKFLQQTATEITGEYNQELNPEPAQLLYDTITNHSRNEVVAKDAVGHALKNVTMESN